MKSRSKSPQVILIVMSALMVLICAITLVSAISWINKPFAGFLIYQEPLVGTMSVGGWPGTKAGLRFLERIIVIDGQPVQSGQDLIDAARQKKSGTVVHYVVQSDDQVRKVSVPVTIFGIKDFFLIFFITFFGGVVLFALGVVVNVLKPDMHSSKIFFYVCLSIGGYMVTSPDSLTTYLFNRINALTLCIFPATVFHLFLIFPHKKLVLKRRPYLEYLIYIPAFILAILYQIYYFGLSNLISPRLIQWFPEFRTLGAVTRSFMLFCAVCMIIFIIHAMTKASTAAARQRARMILFGVSVGFLIPVLLMVAVYLLKVNFPWNFLVLFVIFFPASIAYSIIKHNLFDADTIIRRTLGYILVSAIVVGAYVLLILSFNVFMGKYQVAQSQAFPIIFTLGVVPVFNPLRYRIQSLVDRIFFRKEYDYGKIIDKIGGAITSLIDLGQILNRLTQTFVSDMFISTTSVMLLSPDGTAYQVYLVDGENRQEVEKTVIKRGEPIVEIIEKRKKELTKIDVLEDPKLRQVSKSCDVFFEKLHANLMVPLIYREKVVGLFSLGEKKSGKSYNRQDLEVFHAVANQGAVAIENARMVDEIIKKERLKTKILDAFGKYVTHEVRDQILEGRIPLDGETKEVTVLFADLRDFTTLAESTTPKEVVRIINSYFREMADAIGQNHGLVLQFIGDEIEAVFGAPLPLENHSTHAVRAALAMRKRLILVNNKLQQQGYGPLKHGIGIHTGNVVAANIGSEDRLSYALVGDTVNVASRIQELSKNFETDILISATTRAYLTESIVVEKLPKTTVKGKKNPVEIFKLI